MNINILNKISSSNTNPYNIQCEIGYDSTFKENYIKFYTPGLSYIRSRATSNYKLELYDIHNKFFSWYEYNTDTSNYVNVYTCKGIFDENNLMTNSLNVKFLYT